MWLTLATTSQSPFFENTNSALLQNKATSTDLAEGV